MGSKSIPKFGQDPETFLAGAPGAGAVAGGAPALRAQRRRLLRGLRNLTHRREAEEDEDEDEDEGAEDADLLMEVEEAARPTGLLAGSGELLDKEVRRGSGAGIWQA